MTRLVLCDTVTIQNKHVQITQSILHWVLL